jgi:hypothetical protein
MRPPHSARQRENQAIIALSREVDNLDTGQPSRRHSRQIQIQTCPIQCDRINPGPAANVRIVKTRHFEIVILWIFQDTIPMWQSPNALNL